MKDSVFKYIWLFGAFVYAVNTNAQEQADSIQADSVKHLIRFNYHINNSLYPFFINQSEKNIFEITNHPLKINYDNISINHFNWDMTDRFAIDRDMLQNYFKPMFYSDYKRNDNLFPGMNAEKINFSAIFRDAFFGFEGATSLSLGMDWNATDKLTITGSPFVTRYFLPFDIERRTSAGLNTMTIYHPTDWLIIRLHGQYAYNGVKNANMLLAPQSSFGGDVLIKFTKSFGLGGGVNYINHAGKWIPQYYPLFHINAAKKRTGKTSFNF